MRKAAIVSAFVICIVIAITCASPHIGGPSWPMPGSRPTTSGVPETMTMDTAHTEVTGTMSTGTTGTVMIDTSATTIEAPPSLSPAPQPAAQPRINAGEVTDIAPGKDYATVQIYYATDRAFTGEAVPGSRVFGPGRGHLTRGISQISIPRLHRIGNIEAPSVLRFEFREDPKRHVVLLNVIPQRQRD